jgi:hypothetical protein
MSGTNYFRLLEAYFDGSIRPNEKAMLESEIKSDPLLKAEFDLQQNIINGISNARKLELKARLASIDVGTTAGVFAGSGVKWLAGTLATVTLFSTLLYWSLYSAEDRIVPIDIQSTDYTAFSTQHNIDPPSIEKVNTVTKEVDKLDKPELDAINEEEAVEPEKISSESTAKVKPQALMSFEDDKLFMNNDDEHLKNLSSRDIEHNRVDKTEIEFLDAIEENENFHYRYFNSKLYLYGDFKREPYEIIELNNKGKKQLFLSHSQEIYIIKDNTSQITKLQKLEDEMLKMEISLIIEE